MKDTLTWDISTEDSYQTCIEAPSAGDRGIVYVQQIDPRINDVHVVVIHKSQINALIYALLSAKDAMNDNAHPAKEDYGGLTKKAAMELEREQRAIMEQKIADQFEFEADAQAIIDEESQ